MASAPAFAAALNVAQAQISAANTNRDGTGTLVDVWTAGASGGILDRITAVATGTTTAGMIRLFWYDGVNTRLFDELEVLAITPSATLRAFRDEIVFEGGLPVKAGWVLRAATHNAEVFNIRAFAGDI